MYLLNKIKLCAVCIKIIYKHLKKFKITFTFFFNLVIVSDYSMYHSKHSTFKLTTLFLFLISASGIRYNVD